MENITSQIVDGNRSIVGIMVESNLVAGNQKLSANRDDMVYGQSVTDACIDWETTEKSILDMHDKLKDVLPKRLKAD